jgi:hypothetical protein
MNYTDKQVENAKTAYNNFLKIRSIASFYPQQIGFSEAEQRCQYHNNIVESIIDGDKQLEKKWKQFFLNEELKKDCKAAELKAKLDSNKAASADILAPIKDIKKLGEFGKWLNTSGNRFRKEHFTKIYTQESVNSFLKQL